ncbi:MAG TPA: ATP-binding protein [Myxococcota bacterium]|nr:ATP-binding protein [Myxococcota bacterium]
MIPRRLLHEIQRGLDRQAAVVLLGPRQVGKTTLALKIAEERQALYLDLELASDRAKLADAEFFLGQHTDELVILDEIQRAPALFETLRGLIDQGRRTGHGRGRFLLLGSASLDLLRQSSESLAGRVTLIEFGPLDVLETGALDVRSLWLRGGFPESYLADDDRDSLTWRRDFVRTYLERDIPQLGPRIPAETLRRFWTMLAHSQGAMLNMSRLASGLGVSGQTVGRYTDLLVDLLLVRRLQPLHRNIGKRLVKSPKVFVRDSGIVHALLGLEHLDDLLGHPVVGPSWEGFVIETLVGLAPEPTNASFFRTTGGAEIDLVLELPNHETWAIEVKFGLVPKVSRGFHNARADIRPDRSFVVYGGADRLPLTRGVEAISLQELARELVGLK